MTIGTKYISKDTGRECVLVSVHRGIAILQETAPRYKQCKAGAKHYIAPYLVKAYYRKVASEEAAQ